MRAFLDQRLFGPVGMTDADPRFDERRHVGRVVVRVRPGPAVRPLRRAVPARRGASATQRLLPDGWVDHARTVVARDPETGFDYGRHWWVWPDQPGSLAAHGYEGQYVVVLPEHDAVVVHLGKTDAAVRDRLVARLRRLIAAL